MSRMEEFFLRTFLGEGNDLEWDQIVESEDPRVREVLDPSLRNLRRGEGIAFLPRRVDGKMIWYVGATSDSELLEARDLVRAFIGETYSSYGSTHRIPLDESDPLDAACLNLAGRCFFKFEVWPDGDLDQQLRVYQKIKLLWAVREESPRYGRPETRPVWRVLLDFELALTHGDRDAAESLLAEIENGRSFTEPNLSFLEVRLLAAFEEWDRLLALETLPTLLRVPRPKRVSGAIMEALVQTRVRPLLQGDVGRSGVREELGRIDRQFGPLFQSDPLPLTPSTALITALSACVTRPPRVAQYQRIVESATAAGFPILDEVQALLGDDPLPEAKPSPAPADSPLSAAQAALNLGDFDLAFEQARLADRSRERTIILLLSANSIATLESAQFALRAHEELRARGDSTPALDRLAEGLSRLVAGNTTPARDWLEWAHLFSDPELAPSAPELARVGSGEWSDLTDVQMSEFANSLEEIPDHAGDYLLQAVPSLLEAFPPGHAKPVQRDLYTVLLQRLALDPGTSAEHLETTLDLLDAILTLGTNPATYRDLTDVCQLTWEKAASPAALDWAIDTCYTLAHHPAPAKDLVMAFFQTVVARLRGWTQVLDATVLSSLRFVGEVLGVDVDSLLPEPESSTEESFDPWLQLDHKVIGIYTLTESAARQAEKALQAFSPGAKVELNSELVCSASLKALARNADVFVLVKRSAKHAATDCVQTNRSGRPVVVPAGKGVSSILRSIQDELSSGSLLH